MKNNEKYIQPITVRPEMKINMMSDAELNQIHEATLTLLQETGVRVSSERALNVFEEAGARVDKKNKIVKISPELLLETIAKAPREYCMASHGDKNLDLYLDGTKTYCGAGGTGNSIRVFETGEIRLATSKDLHEVSKICDYLPEVSYCWPMASPIDINSQLAALNEIETCFINTEKHVHSITCIDPDTARYAIEMARVIAGGSEEARKRPPLSLLVCPISPLCHEAGPLEAGLAFAEAGLPVGIATMPCLGSTGPATIPSTMVSGNAEILSAISLIQLSYPGAPVYYALFSMMMNPYTGSPVTGFPQQHLLNAAVVQLGQFYNIPTLTAFIGNDASDMWSWQGGVESSIGALQCILQGPDLTIGAGMTADFTAASAEKLIMDSDIIKTIKSIAEGFSVDAESIALDEIMAVGPQGHFLDTRHTATNVRKLWSPGISYQWSSLEKRFSDPKDVTVERVKRILENHNPEILDSNMKNELQKIIKNAEKQLIK
ncbi:MAG: trimethylamine methyltransferase family protein [Desulfobacula sp.]|jgi:trimethylamine--corrinoid protein Co-methyltransferase|nr:trimethylamine methyltransferase family protein [Desulfobacula sp.]